jgi:hypothetical protein
MRMEISVVRMTENIERSQNRRKIDVHGILNVGHTLRVVLSRGIYIMNYTVNPVFVGPL